jgi:hypothetical protein
MANKTIGLSRAVANIDLAAFDHAAFSQLTGTWFQVRNSRGSEQFLTLVQTTAGSAQPGLEAFILLFQGTARNAIGQGTYRFSHPRLGSFEMFIVPKPGDGTRVYYEALFNRLV